MNWEVMALPKISKRTFLKSAAAAALAPVVMAASKSTSVRTASESTSAQGSTTPNVVLICNDDLGYGDLSCYGPSVGSVAPGRATQRAVLGTYGSSVYTPNIDLLAQDGVLFRHFNAAGPVCSPSRASLLTGRYAPRVGVVDVLFPTDPVGFPDSETSIAGMLKPLGYTTMCVGKWHLGSEPQFLPTNHGFDEFYGLPYSHDMSPLPLMHNLDVIEEPTDLTTLMLRYTEQAVSFIANTKNSPFFLYFAPFLPHIPLVVSDQFSGKSGMGAYGDAIQAIDWSVGQIMNALAMNGIDSNTLVIFTSDHGPWYQGSSANLRGRKGETFEGGVRVPFIARFPGRIPAGLIRNELASHMDILPTVAALCGAPLPPKPLDGMDIWPLFTGAQMSANRDALLYFDCWNIQCARLSVWKLHVARYNCTVWGPLPAGGRLNLPLPKPELYRLDVDPGERCDVADGNPDIVSRIMTHIEALLPNLPAQVQNNWSNTMSLQVQPTPTGALPVLAG
jgi:arylsulfatase A